VRDDTRTPRVRFHECAVVVPTTLRDTVLPVLREVFDEAHGLPRVVWRQPLGAHNTIAALARQLLELPATRLRRADVLAILGHPLVAQAFADDAPDQWSSWLDAVGIFHGLHERSHDGTYLEGQVAADWDQGLQRLALGAFVGAERSGDVQAIAGPRGAMIPEEIAQSSSSSLGLLVQLVRSLLSDAHFLRSAHLPAAEWASLLSTYIATYVRPVDPGGQRVRTALLRALDNVADCGVVGAFGWEIARREAAAALDGVHAHQGQHLQQGILVGAPEDLAGLPFRCVAVLGVQQGGFPSSARHDELDLRPDDDTHRPDDPRRRDSHALYELVQSARDEVCLVPIAHDPLTGEAREVSLLVRDLEEHRRAHAPTTLVPAVDLHLHRRAHAHEPDFAWAFPEAVVERDVAAFGAGLRVDGRALPDVRALSPAWRATLGASPLPPLPPRGDDVVHVPVSRLVRFLEHPTRGYAEQRLDYRGDDEDRDDVVDEPFEHAFLVQSSITQEVLYGLAQRHSRDELADDARRAQLVRATYERVIARRRADGTLPLGFFLDVQRELDEQALDTLVLRDLAMAAFAPPYRRLKWGQAAVFGDDDILELAPVDLDVPLEGGTRRVRVQGLGSLITPDRGALYRFSATVKDVRDWTAGLGRKAGLHAWVEHLLLACGDDASARRSLASGAAARFERPFQATSRDDAAAALRTILHGLLHTRTAFCCPSVSVLQNWETYATTASWPERRALLEQDIDVIFKKVDLERYSPVRAVQRLRRPDEAEFEALCARYRPFIDDESAVSAATGSASAAANTRDGEEGAGENP
jgi:exonuclease V gamma subunit